MRVGSGRLNISVGIRVHVPLIQQDSRGVEIVSAGGVRLGAALPASQSQTCKCTVICKSYKSAINKSRNKLLIAESVIAN